MSKQLTFQVNGTKCASCEIVLERELKTIPGVEKVSASHDKGEIVMTVADNTALHPKDLEAVVGKHGYRFSELSRATSYETRAPSYSWKRVGATLVIIAGLYLLFQRLGLLQFSPDVEGGTSLGAVFVIGLVAAVSSCTAVVGGLIVAVSTAAAKRNPNLNAAQKIRPHLVFNAGRLAGFAVFGALIGLVGQVLSLSAQTNGVLVIVIALIMIGLGVNLLDLFPKDIVKFGPPKWLSRRIVALADSTNPFVSFILGALTFFLPCGFTQSMQLYALSTGDPANAALIMTIFAIGTLPALLGIGMVTSLAKGASLRWVTKTAGAMVIVLGVSNVGNGATLLGLAWPTVSSATATPTSTLVDGAQHLEMEVTPYGVYAPDTFTVVEDTPVNWNIFGSDNMGCGQTLVAPAFRIQERLNPGFNEVNFTPTEPGTYVFSCSMGMIRGTMIVVPKGNS